MMKSRMKNSTKKLLLLAAATVTAASAIAVGTGGAFSANASTEENYAVAYSQDEYSCTYYRAGEYKITDSGPMKQSYDVFTWNISPSYKELVAQDFHYLTVSIRLSMKEEDKGYQQVFLYPTVNAGYDQYIARIEVQYGGDGATKNYGVVTFDFKSLDIGKFAVNGNLGFVIRYGATGGGEDDWYNKDMTVTVTASKDIIKKDNTATGNIIYDYGYNNP